MNRIFGKVYNFFYIVRGTVNTIDPVYIAIGYIYMRLEKMCYIVEEHFCYLHVIEILVAM